MVLTSNDLKLLTRITKIGKGNISMKEVASSLGISYGYMMRRLETIAKNNGYHTTRGFLIDYAVEQAIREKEEGR